MNARFWYERSIRTGAIVEGLPVNKGSKKEYLNVKTRLAWRAWKAGANVMAGAFEKRGDL